MSKRRAERRAIAGAALVFEALGDPTRLELLHRLAADGPASISTLAERFAITRQGVTKHLHVLAAAGTIHGSRQGREQVWSLNPVALGRAKETLDAIASSWDDALLRLRAHVERG
jgi:DNA-binding transcriptional ArsR family regulator